MPRKRKAARGYQRPLSNAHAEVERRFPLRSWALGGLEAETFYEALESEALRRAFAEIYPAIFYCRLYQFEASEADRYPASAVTYFGACVFRRHGFLAFLEANPPKVPFEAPDLRGVAYRDRYVMLARARMAWWKANDWPRITDAEHEWLLYDGPRQKPAPHPAAISMPPVGGVQ